MLSDSLSLSGFCATAHRGLTNAMPVALLDNARRVAGLWEIVLRALGPCVLTSGYRSPRLNALVGGSRRSAHLDARAIDLVPSRVDAARGVQDLVAWCASGAPFDKIILESVSHRAWIHIQAARSGEEPAKIALMTFDAVHYEPFVASDDRVGSLA